MYTTTNTNNITTSTTTHTRHTPSPSLAGTRATGRARRRWPVGRRTLVAALAIGCAPALAACGDDAGAASDGVLAVTMADFHFGDLPDAVPAGTRLAVTNASDVELHELVAFQLPDGDDRTVDQILSSGLEELLTSTPPTAVLLAPPDGDQVAAVGDGTLDVPGRYLLLCAIPTGVDPTEYLAAAATSDGPPQVPGGPPHFAHGMAADLLVTD